MAPNKFEKHIKKQLEEREIKPSENAWNTLSEKLDTVPKSRRKGYLWYGIAASLIGLLIVSVVYLDFRNSSVIEHIQLVDSPVESKTSNTPDEEIRIDFPIEEHLVEKLNTIGSKENLINKEVIDVKVEKVTINKLVKNEILEDTASPFEDGFVESKVQEVIAQVDALEEKNMTLTDVEVDSLLRKAQEEILRDKLFNQSGSVDALALLTEVEGELDESFRDQIFESLKAGFLKVRTAVADRNN
jgi:hypothetical protein